MNKHSKSVLPAWWTILLLLFSNGVIAADYPARLEWERRVELSTPVQGVISEVSARAGQRVDAGTVLIQLDDRGFKANVRRARSRVESLAAARAEARREHERAIELYDRTVLSNHELQVAENAAKQADAEYAAARAALVEAQLTLEYSAVRAPFDALVISVAGEKGQTVVNNLQPVTLVTVADANSMVARAELSEAQVSELEVGQEAVVRIGGQRHSGTIKSIGLEPVAASGNYPVAVSFALDNARYRVGQSATIELP